MAASPRSWVFSKETTSLIHIYNSNNLGGSMHIFPIPISIYIHSRLSDILGMKNEEGEKGEQNQVENPRNLSQLTNLMKW